MKYKYRHFIVIFRSQKLEKHYAQKQKNILVTIFSYGNNIIQSLKVIYFRILSNIAACKFMEKTNIKVHKEYRHNFV